MCSNMYYRLSLESSLKFPKGDILTTTLETKAWAPEEIVVSGYKSKNDST